MTVVFGAGGTAGHVFMARGIASYIRDKTVLITDERGAKYCCDCSSCVHKGGHISCSIFDEVVVLPIRYIRFGEVKNLIKAFIESFKCLRRCENPVFVGCGAYTSLIVGITAKIQNIPIYIYQGDQIIGRANQILQWFAHKSWVSSDKLQLRNPVVVGCIARDEIVSVPMQNTGKFRILVVGSSVGSSLLASILPRVLDHIKTELRSKIEIVHQAQTTEAIQLKEEYARLGVEYSVESFVNNVVELPRAHLVIARAGWSLISDIIASKRAAIFIPWPGAMKNHQYYNALWIAEGTQWMIEEEKCNAQYLAPLITTLATDMLKRNCGTTVEFGMIAERARYEGFEARAGQKIAEFINSTYSSINC